MKGRSSKRSTERKRAKKTVDTSSRPAGAGERPGATRPEAAPRQTRESPATSSPEAKRARRAPAKPVPETAAKLAPEAETAPATEAHKAKQHSFPIVGIGASAGGLEALQEFFKRVPAHSGMAFVVIQHLDPTNKGMMVELLQRSSVLPVVQAKDRVKVEVEHVYVIPPNHDLSILHGTLHLLPKASPRGLNLPIDFFLRSLAEDQHERGIGVVLSGMGSDGTLGLRAIKEKAGAAFVQALTSAKFDSMPRSVIDAGLADVVAPVEELPGRIMAYRQYAPRLATPDAPAQEKTQSALDKVFVLLRTHTGNDFSLYKTSTIHRRVERRMGLHQLDKLEHYVRFLRENPGETDLLFKELLIGVTSLFRDPAAWEQLKSQVMPELASAHRTGGVLRAWVPGCSTGEEAYSLAIVFKEAVDQLTATKNIKLQIFATDLDQDAIEKARQGFFPPNIAADVTEERLRRFFVKSENGYRVSKDLREMVVFAPQNVIMDPPFTKLDLLLCRNLLIYLSAELQKKLIPIFHYCLNFNGILFLGSAETIGSFSHLFSPLEGKTRLFRRLGPNFTTAPIDFPSSFTPRIGGVAVETNAEVAGALKASPPNLQALADRAIALRLSPPVVLTDDKGDIVYIAGRTGNYLEPAAGKANMNIFAMAREGLRYQLTRTFSAALRSERPATARGVQVGTNGGTQTVDITVQNVTEPREVYGLMMVVIADVAQSSTPTARGKARRVPADGPRHSEMEKELLLAQQDLQSTREEMQTSQEELKSANEELQSTNEELQSTNEELTTSKEEMQSMNEELQTVNQELQARVDELSRSSSDMTNLLNSTDIATLFLDGELHVGRFTPQVTKIINLIPSDAGRPFDDIKTALDYPELVADAREVLRTLAFKEKMVAASDSRWFSVRIMPYRTLNNVIDGLVITFTDATASKALEAALQQKERHLRELADSLPQLVWSSRVDGAFDYLSRQWIDYTGVPEPEQLDDGWLLQVSPEDRERVRTEWSAAIKSGATFDSEFRILSSKGEPRWFKARAAPVRDAQGLLGKWYGTCADINDLRPEEEARRRLSERTMSILESMSEAVFSLDRDLAITYSNAAAERLLGRRRAEVLGKHLVDVLPEAGGAVCDKKYRQALADKMPLAFEIRFETAPNEGWCGVRVLPQAEGLSILFQRREATQETQGGTT
jgi:two-component system CheB/CheR fusion protein